MQTPLPAVLVLAVMSAASGGDWPGWRGPTSNGVAAPGDYPLKWTATDGVAWRLDLPGPAGSTPCVTGDRVILTGPLEGNNSVFAVSRDGKLLWTTHVGKDVGGKHKKGSGANPSPATNGKLVFAYFKSGDLAALDLNGKIVWHFNAQEKFGASDLWWDLGTSPVLTSRHLVVAVMQTANSYIAALDPATGDLAWKVDRNLGAPKEAGQSYSTPVVFTHGGREQLVLVGGDHVTCHAAEDGRELWRVGGLNPEQNKFFRSIAGPVVDSGLVIAPYARGNTLTGIRLGGMGDVTISHVVWRQSDTGSDVPTPAAANGRFYLSRDKAARVECRQVATGELIWSRDLPKSRNGFSASPLLAGGRLYCTREDGATFVLDAATGTVEAENPLGESEFVVATPIAVDGQLLLRTFQRLYCVGRQ